MDDQDDTSGQTTPERDATNHMEFPANQSIGRLPSNIRTYKPTGYERPRRIFLEVKKYQELMSAKHSLDSERQVMRFEKESLKKKVQELYRKLNQKESLIEELNQKLQTALENLDAEKAENQIIYKSFALRSELCGRDEELT